MYQQESIWGWVTLHTEQKTKAGKCIFDFSDVKVFFLWALTCKVNINHIVS